jgi:hypothetical protein
MLTNKYSVRLLTLTVILCCTASAQKVKTGYDKATDFSKFKTYSWAKSDKPSSRPLLREHVIGSIDHELNSKGLQRIADGGDLVVAAAGGMGFESNTQGGAPILPIYGGAPVSMDATMWSGTGGGGAGNYFSEGTLGVDLVDTAARKLVWRGTVTEKFDIDKKTESVERLSKAITKLFKDFPPKKEH